MFATLVSVATSVSWASEGELESLVLGHEPTFLQRLNQSEPLRLTNDQLELSNQTIQQLAELEPGDRISVPSLAKLIDGGQTDIELRRINLYTDDAKLVIDQVPQSIKSIRRFFVGGSAENRIALSLDADGRLSATIKGQQASYQLAGSGKQIAASPLTTPADASMFCENDLQHDMTSSFLKLQPEQETTLLPSLLGVATNVYEAGIAIDTDNEFLANKFGDDTGAARRWIEDMFLAMNSFYVPDLSMELKISYLRLRVAGSDPNPAGFNTSLGNFADHWESNAQLQNVDRVFAALLSSFDISSNSFSGIAYLGPSFTYCNRGGYSRNRIGSASFIGPTFIAGGVGHEIGHNLGSRHTHCERLANNGTNFIDECSTAGGGCYSGAASCPADGSGTIMSYCNSFLYEGPGSCSDSDEFHPLIIQKLMPFIDSRAPACIGLSGAPASTIFSNGFE